MDAKRRVILDGALAIAGDHIVAVGKREALAQSVVAKRRLNARRFVITPGFVDGHIHITGDPLTRGLRRGAPGEAPSSVMSRWVIPIFRAHTAQEEALSAQVAALAMMRAGTTCFLEAGTVSHLDAVMEALEGTGIRGRLGEWVEGRAYDPSADAKAVCAAAIAVLEREVERWPADGRRLAAWPILVGHSTNPDEVWRAAKALADANGLGVSAHMSPRSADPEWFLATYGERPLAHLARIGVLGDNVCLTHLACIDEGELEHLAASGAHAIFCPHAAIQGAFGVSRQGLYPEMVAGGVNVLLGTDGVATNLPSSARLMAGIFRDARFDAELFPPTSLLELITVNGARALRLAGDIGSLEAGKKADFVLHDTDVPEWGPVVEPVSQLALSAPARAVHSVWIDGVQVIDDGRATLFDEEALLARARVAGAEVIARTGLPPQSPWPVL